MTIPVGRFTAAIRAAAKAGVAPLLMRDVPDDVDRLDELDLLVTPDAAEKFCAAVIADGWELQDTGAFIPAKRALVLLSGRQLLKIDLHLAYIDGPHTYMDAELALTRATPHPTGFLLPSPEDWFWHVLMHIVLAKSGIDPKYRSRLVAMTSTTLDRDYLRTQAKAFGLMEVLEYLLNNPVSTLDDHQERLRLQRMARRSLRRLPGNLLREATYKLVWSLGQAAGLRRGFSIAFVGPDGAGKSTTIAAFRDLFRDLQIPVRDAYFGPWERNILPTSTLFRRLGINPNDTVVPPSATTFLRLTKKLKGTIRGTACYMHVALDMWMRWLLLVMPHLLLRRTVLMDRYIYDIIIGYYNTPMSSWHRLRKFICWIYPRPTFTILLDNEAAEIWSRKKEFPLDLIAGAIARYRILATESHFFVVKTEQPPEIIAEAFVAENWRMMIACRRDRGWCKLFRPSLPPNRRHHLDPVDGIGHGRRHAPGA